MEGPGEDRLVVLASHHTSWTMGNRVEDEADPGPRLMALLGHPDILQVLQWNYSVAWTAFAFMPIFFIALRAHGAARLDLHPRPAFVAVVERHPRGGAPLDACSTRTIP